MDIRSSPTAQTSSLKPSQIDALVGYQQIFWLIDPILVDPCQALPALQALQCRPLNIQHDAMTRGNRPRLMYADRSENLLKTASEVWIYAQQECLTPMDIGKPRARSVCALVATNLPAEELADTLSNAALVFDTDNEKRILRYWDPRVMQHAVRDNKLDALLPKGFDGAWTYLDACAIPEQIVVQAESTSQTAKPTRLTPSQQAWLEEISHRNAVFERAFGCDPVSADKAWSRVVEGWMAASQAPLTNQADRIVYAAIQAEINEPIEFSARMRELLHHVAEYGVKLGSLYAELTDDDKQQIAMEAREHSKFDATTRQPRPIQT